MPVVIVVGVQWGDEGKGKLVDYLTERADLRPGLPEGHAAPGAVRPALAQEGPVRRRRLPVPERVGDARGMGPGGGRGVARVAGWCAASADARGGSRGGGGARATGGALRP